jgi:hypothetical protein
MSLGETLTLVKAANAEKSAGGWLSGLGAAAGAASKPLLWGAALGPPVLGGVAGWGTARATEGMNERTPDEIKQQELIDELRQQTQRARLQTLLAKRRKQRESIPGRSIL